MLKEVEGSEKETREVGKGPEGCRKERQGGAFEDSGKKERIRKRRNARKGMLKEVEGREKETREVGEEPEGCRGER